MSQYDILAQELVSKVRQSLPMQIPQGEGMVLYLPEAISFGTIQRVYSDYDSDMVFLSKTTRAFQREIGDAMLKIAPEFHRLTVAQSLSLEGRLHVLRLQGSLLDYMTPQQMQYALAHPLQIFEHNSVDFH